MATHRYTAVATGNGAEVSQNAYPTLELTDKLGSQPSPQSHSWPHLAQASESGSGF